MSTENTVETTETKDKTAWKKVKIKLQRPANTKSKGQTVSVNNHRYFIPYGKVVEVPFFIAEIARLSSEQDEQTAAMIDELSTAD